jgi:hypothetical protein
MILKSHRQMNFCHGLEWNGTERQTKSERNDGQSPNGTAHQQSPTATRSQQQPRWHVTGATRAHLMVLMVDESHLRNSSARKLVRLTAIRTYVSRICEKNGLFCCCFFKDIRPAVHIELLHAVRLLHAAVRVELLPQVRRRNLSPCRTITTGTAGHS